MKPNLEAITMPELKGPEDVRSGIASAFARLEELRSRDELNGGELANVKAAVEALLKDMADVKPAAMAATRSITNSLEAGIDGLNLSFEAPEGLSKLHFNLLTKTPSELTFASQFAASHRTRTLLSNVGMSADWQRKHAEFQALSDTLYLTDVMLCAANPELADNTPSRTERMKRYKLWKQYAALTTEFRKAANTALDTQTAAEGLEWVPTMFSAQLIEAIQVNLVVASLFERVPMPSGVYKFPVMGQDMIAYKMAEGLEEGATKVTAKRFVTKNATFTATKLGARLLTSREFDEDSLVPVVPKIVAQIGKALARGIDDAIMNGDTTATHMDADVTASDDARKSWKGLRKLALANSVTVNGAHGDLTIRDHALGLRKKMGVYGATPGQLVYIAGFASAIELMLSKDDAGNNILLTVDKYGPGAAVLTGECGKIGGVPVVVSEFSRETINASGVQDGVTTDRGTIQLVNREAFALGERRAVTITRLLELYAETDQIGVVGTWRGDFQPWHGASEKSTGAILDVQC